MVRLSPAPATGVVVAADSDREEAVVGLTVKLLDVPVIPRVAVRVGDWASVRVILAVPEPLVKVTEAG